MSGIIRGYIRIVDVINLRVGRIMMYGIFALMAILFWSSVSKTFLYHLSGHSKWHNL